MAGFMVPEVWCDRCSLREQSEDEGTLRELRADLRLDGWVRRRTAEGLIDLCYRCAGTILTVRPVDAWPGVLAADSERWTR